MKEKIQIFYIQEGEYTPHPPDKRIGTMHFLFHGAKVRIHRAEAAITG